MIRLAKIADGGRFAGVTRDKPQTPLRNDLYEPGVVHSRIISIHCAPVWVILCQIAGHDAKNFKFAASTSSQQNKTTRPPQ
jgi:hypothetical protein